jgi:hypothetical protein
VRTQARRTRAHFVGTVATLAGDIATGPFTAGTDELPFSMKLKGGPAVRLFCMAFSDHVESLLARSCPA